MVCVAIDPGKTGAFAVMRGRELLTLGRWKPVQRQQQRVIELTVRGSGKVLLPTLAHVGQHIGAASCEHRADCMVVEAQYVQANARTGLGLARNAGYLSAWCLITISPERLLYPPPMQWRAAAGAVGKMKRDEAKAWAMATAAELVTVSDLTPDEAEAVLMAWAGPRML